MSLSSTPEKYPESTAEMDADAAARSRTDCAPSTTSRKRPRKRLRLGQSPTVDGRSKMARVFRGARVRLVESLGGKENLTPAQEIAIRLASEAEALRAGVFAGATRDKPFESEDWARFAKTTLQSLTLLFPEGLHRRFEKNVDPMEELNQLKRKPATINGESTQQGGAKPRPD